MELKFDIVKGQTFEIGRTINPFLCDCKECDFINCPKGNYAIKVRQHIYKVEDFISHYTSEIIKRGFLTEELLNEFMECFRFPKGTYWDIVNFGNAKIRIISFNRRGVEVIKGTINLKTGEIWDCDLSKKQHILAERLSKGIKKVYEFIGNNGLDN